MCLYIPAVASWLISLAPGLTAMVHLSCGWIHLPGVKWLYEEESGRRENTYVSPWNLHAINRSGQRKKAGRQEDGKDPDSPAWPAASYKDNSKRRDAKVWSWGLPFPSCGCCNKLPQTWRLKAVEIDFLRGVKVRSLKSLSLGWNGSIDRTTHTLLCLEVSGAFWLVSV